MPTLILTILYIFSSLALSQHTYANEGDSEEKKECSSVVSEANLTHNLSLDERWQLLDKNDDHRVSQRIKLTNEAFSPVLIKFSEDILSLSDENIERLLEPYLPGPDSFKFRVSASHQLDQPFKGPLDNRYKQNLSIAGLNEKYNIGVNPENYKIMKSVSVTNHLLLNEFLESYNKGAFEDLLVGSKKVIEETTFYNNPVKTMEDNLQTYNQVLTQLTITPMPWLTDIQYLGLLLTSINKVSLVSQMALLYPPEFIGQNGKDRYFNEPLIWQDDALILNPVMTKRIKAEKKKYSNSPSMFSDLSNPKYKRTCKGCPVAHKDGNEKSSLDIFNEAFLRFFTVIHLKLNSEN